MKRFNLKVASFTDPEQINIQEIINDFKAHTETDIEDKIIEILTGKWSYTNMENSSADT